MADSFRDHSAMRLEMGTMTSPHVLRTAEALSIALALPRLQVPLWT